MKKLVIVNDVNVSECKFFTQEHDLDFSKCGHICKDTFCKYKHNYLLKKLKRKEQECKSLCNKLQKMENNCIEIFNLFSELGKKYTKSKRECENLKKELSAYGATGICETCSDKSVLKADELLAQNAKYKKYIESIKARINSYKEMCSDFCKFDKNKKSCACCFFGGAVELGENIKIDIERVEE